MSADRPKEGRTDALDQCVMTESFIDITAKKLIGLRNLCTTTEGFTQKLICETESKLIRLFGKQLVAKRRLKAKKLSEKLQKYPNTEQWLYVLGINDSTSKCLLRRGLTVEQMIAMSPHELTRLMERFNSDPQELHHLLAALRNLRIWTDLQLSGEKSDGGVEVELSWSCGTHKLAGGSPRDHGDHGDHGDDVEGSPQYHHRSSSSSSPHTPNSPETPRHHSSALPGPSPVEQRRRFTPPPTPPLVKPSRGKFPTTPPPNRRIQLNPSAFYPLTKSKSHESKLSQKVNQDVPVDLARYMKESQETGSQRPSVAGTDTPSRCPSGQTSPLPASPRRSPPFKHSDSSSLIEDVHPLKKNQLSVPISPNAHLGSRGGNMKHAIAHRFQSKLIISTCDLCNKSVLHGKVCRECKAKYHKECAAKAAPACGLPQELLALYLESLSTGDGSPGPLRRVSGVSVPTFQAPDSSTPSSCSSSTPSSPAPGPPTSPPTAPCHSSPTTPHPSPHIEITSDQQFTFPPDLSYDQSSLTTIDSIGTASTLLGTSDHEPSFTEDVVNTNTSNDSDKSDRTVVDMSNDKNPTLDRMDSQEIGEDGLYPTWTRVNSISITLKEWDIPFSEVELGEEKGKGRFGTVYKGKWHGEVAIKMLKTDPEQDNQAQLQAFKLEIAMLRKTRHENLVLFMGACMKHPHLAIVTSLCRGQTLYTHVHVRREKFNINRAIIIASQIAQGMGYLHDKRIIHRDLKSKNIFLEGGKVIITDFGLFSVTNLCHGSRKGAWLNIPQGWLCYLSPEIMRSLHTGTSPERSMPFAEASDVYAFGTVWYEILSGEWPFRNQPPEVIIWQVGKGIKQPLSSLQASRDVKDILMMCWAFHGSDRPTFASLLQTFERLPKKRLARSPSHPIQLSRSAESVF